ncbi:hypothetical protein [Lacrimispora xylanolytica]
MEHLLETNRPDLTKTYQTLSMLARYYFHMKGLENKRNMERLHIFMEAHYPKYNPVDWSETIESCVSRAPKYPLCLCDGIWITDQEIKTIESLSDKVLERLAFTLLCLAKYGNFRNKENNNWVTNSDSEIYKMACITTKAYDKDIRFHKLRELGLIEFAKKIDNLSIRVLFSDESEKGCAFIRDFRKLGYEWRVMKGENYIRCVKCGILVRRTSLNRKYCTDCTKQNPYYSPIGTKKISCIDCGITFEAVAASRECRCEACKLNHKREIQKMKARRYRSKTMA